MYFGGHCTIHTCQYNEGKFDLEIYLSVICSYLCKQLLKYSLTLIQSKAASFQLLFTLTELKFQF